MPVPKFSISANGVDITDKLTGLGMTMTITDGVGEKSDTMSIVIDDVDGSVVAPKTGAVLNPVGGYEGNMRDFGQFSVDSVVFSGWPQQITIQAKSVAAKSLAKQRDPKAYPQKSFATYGDIFADVAKTVGLSLVISESIRVSVNLYEAQTEESSLEFMTRIGEKLNASVTVKSGKVVVVERGEGAAASGTQLPDILVQKGVNVLSYSVTERDEPKHSSVETSYYDRKENKKKTHTESTGMDGPKFCVRTPSKDKDEAERVAKSQAKKLVRDSREASFSIDGDPFAQAEAQAFVRGIRSNVDGIWSVKNVTHEFSSSGAYTTDLSCTEANKKNSEGKSGPYTGKPSATASGSKSNAPVIESGSPSLTGDAGSAIG